MDININEIKRLLSAGERSAISISTFEKIIELLEQKTQLSIEQSRELIILRQELLAKEQECEEWRHDFARTIDLIDNFRITKEDLQHKCKEYEKAFDSIKEIVNEPCVMEEDCEHCSNDCEHRDILNIIKRAEEQ